jgi:hypothetical protein
MREPARVFKRQNSGALLDWDRVISPVDDLEAAARFYAALLDQPGFRVSPGVGSLLCFVDSATILTGPSRPPSA